MRSEKEQYLYNLMWAYAELGRYDNAAVIAVRLEELAKG